MPNTNNQSTITVLGLGAMGTAIARAAAAEGHSVLAWNRTPKPAEHFHGTGIELVTSLPTALLGSDLFVVCVRDHDASRVLLEQIAPEAAGRVVVNVSTGTPHETVESATRAAKLGVRYVTGAVMVPTDLVATDNCVVIYAGNDDDLAEVKPLFDAMGGTSDIVGTDHAVPVALDLAMLDIYFAGMYAHLHATALAGAYGIEAGTFLPYARGIVDTLEASLAGLTSAVVRRRYDGGEARLDMCLSFLGHIVAASRQSGIEPGLAEVVRAVSERALTTWPGSTDWDITSTSTRLFTVIAAATLTAGVACSSTTTTTEPPQTETSISAQDKVPESAVDWEPGSVVTIADLAVGALTKSDNTSGNLLTREAGGAAALTQFARSLGDTEFRLDRTEPELNTAIPGDPRDTTTANSMAAGYRTLLDGEALSSASRDQLLAWMGDTQTSDARFRASIAPEWTSADKTGTGSYGVSNDAGLLLGPDDQRILLVVLSTTMSGIEDTPAMNTLVAEATRQVVDELE